MILVTGGAGYIGSHVNKELNKRHYSTLIYDNLSCGHQELVKSGEFFLADTGDPAALNAVFEKFPIQAVIHTAASTYVSESAIDPRKYYINNLHNTILLVNVMLKHNVKCIVFSSSCAVYGNPATGMIGESHPCDPVNPYGKSKWMVEKILEDYERAYGLRYVSLRCFSAAGADPDLDTGEWHDPETHLIPLVLDAAMGRRDAVFICGNDYHTPDGTCIRDYIHVTDIARAHVLAMEHLLHGGASDILNLSNGKGFSVREVIETARSVTGENIRVLETNRRPGDPPVLVGSAQMAQNRLRWAPAFIDLSDMIHTAWQWHLRRWSGPSRG